LDLWHEDATDVAANRFASWRGINLAHGIDSPIFRHDELHALPQVAL
jgi:hypothetical protein